MQKSFPSLIAVGLLSLSLALPALARDWNDDFTPREPSLRQSGHWEWAWDGDDGLGVSVAATVRYVPGGPARISVNGPDELLEKLRVGEGQIRWCEDCRIRGGRLEITVSGVTLHNVALRGGLVLALRGRRLARALRRRLLALRQAERHTLGPGGCRPGQSRVVRCAGKRGPLCFAPARVARKRAPHPCTSMIDAGHAAIARGRFDAVHSGRKSAA